MHRQSEHGLIKYSIRIKSRMSWPISLLRNHFLIKSSRSSLFSDQNKLRLMTFNGQQMSFWYVSHMRKVALKWGLIP